MAFSAVGALNWMREANKNYMDSKIAEQNLISRREDALLSLYIKNGGAYTNKKTGKEYNTAAKNALVLQDRVNTYGESTNDPDTIEFYNNILQDPMAASEVMDFITEQETKYNRIIPIQDVPNYINIINAPNISVDEKIDIFKELDLADLTDKEEYYELASKIQNMTTKSGRTVFTDVAPGSQISQDETIKLADQQYEMMTGLLVPVAQTYLNNNPEGTQAVETASAIQNLESADEFVKSKARKYLFETYTKPDFVSNLETTMPRFFRGLGKIPQVVTLFEAQKPLEGGGDPPPIVPTVYPTPTPDAVAALMANPTEQMIREFNDFYGPNKASDYLN